MASSSGTTTVAVTLTRHARARMGQRSISSDAVIATLEHGRIGVGRAARRIYTLGRREVEAVAAEGVDVSEHEGVRVVCSDRGIVLTVYRTTKATGRSGRCGSGPAWLMARARPETMASAC